MSAMRTPSTHILELLNSIQTVSVNSIPAVGLYVRTSGFIFFRIDSPISY